MANLNLLYKSITEIPFTEAMDRIMASRYARRAALTESIEARKTAKVTKPKGRPKKEMSLDAIASALTPEQKQQLLDSLLGD